MTPAMDGGTSTGDAGTDAGTPPGTDPIVPAGGTIAFELLDCTGAYTPPDALTGGQGLGSFGWTLGDLTFTLAWNAPNRFVNRWISSNDDAVPSARVRPWLTPAAGACFKEALAGLAPGATTGEPFLGFGALVDLGDGADTHTADTFSMGQGFVYGFGALFDGGGDDRYRSFWWGPGAAAHMGVALFVDEGGNDDVYVTRASAGFGFDASVAWILDHGGNDTYGGRFHYGEAYTYGLTFFINEGGDDTYNAGAARMNPIFGGVNRGYQGANLVGAFLDLGGGNDTYVSAPAEVANEAAWYLPPVNPLMGQTLDPAHHKGIGLDD